MTAGLTVLAVLVGVLLVGLAFGLIVFLTIRLCQGLGMLIAHTWRFVSGMVGDTFRFFGALIVALVFSALVTLNVVIGRWSASGHYGRAFTNELQTAGLCLYRVCFGHPVRFLGLGGMAEGLEHRLPQAMAHAPGPDLPKRLPAGEEGGRAMGRGRGMKEGVGGAKGRAGMFPGYRVVGSLPGGGSGGKLYVAEPTPEKRAGLERRLGEPVDKVVIKSFSLTDGSSLPQIVRESRSLDAAKKMGLILEHELSDERFYYAMAYVPGESLSIVADRLHGQSSTPDGLDAARLRAALRHVRDLLVSLDAYHRGGLWHKDVKPDNIIVAQDGSAHLVDFGLITPLRSAMTLTTHGTEYFRDPEMVRQALKGARVHDIDGARFDIYGAGAVLYSVIENSFPAHGALSRISKRCPESLRWIVRRAMADYEKRYRSAAEMLADVEVVLAAEDPFAVRPAQLPSLGAAGAVGGCDDPAPVPVEPAPAEELAELRAAVAPAEPVHLRRAGTPPPVPAPRAMPFDEGPRTAPRLRLVNWWSGRYEVDRDPTPPPPPMPRPAPAPAGARRHAAAPRPSAAEQLRNARARAAARRRTAQARMHGRPHAAHPTPGGVTAGIVGGVLLMLALVGGGAFLALGRSGAPSVVVTASVEGPAAPGAPLPRLEDAVLLVSDFNPPLPSAVRSHLAAVVETLAAAGARIEGAGVTGLPADGADDEEAVLGAVAHVRKARGVAPLEAFVDRDRAAGLVEEIVAALEAGERYDSVLWVGPLSEAGAYQAVWIGLDGAVTRVRMDVKGEPGAASLGLLLSRGAGSSGAATPPVPPAPPRPRGSGRASAFAASR